MKKRIVVLGLGLGLAGAACASAPLPASELGRAEGSVRTAEAMGARQEPAAALHLRLANENLARGRQLIADGEHERARFVLDRASAEAELARSLVHEAHAKAQADQAQQEVQRLQASIQQEGAQ